MNKLLLGLALSCFGVVGAANAQVYTQTFESATIPALPTGMTSMHTGAGNGWVTNNTDVPWGLGTLPAHTTYAFVDEYTHHPNTLATMTTPSFSLVGVANPYLSFDCFYFGAQLSASPYTPEKAWVSASTNGTTFTVLDTLSATDGWEKQYISLAAYSTSATVYLQFGYKDNGGNIIGVAIDSINVFSAPTTSAALTDIFPVQPYANAYAAVGNNITLQGTVFNKGATPITSFTFKYSVDGGTPVSNTITPGTAIAPFTSANFTATTPYTMAAVGSHPVKEWISLTGDTNPLDDSASAIFIGASFNPTKKMVMEEATGTWCGYCVRGIVYMDSLRTLYGNNVSLIAVHNSDPMVVTAYDTWIGGFISGYPSVVIDRTYTTDPQNLLAYYNAFSTEFGFADITTSFSVSGTTVTVPVTVKPALNIAGAKLAMVLTEDDVHGTTSAWAQHNYYSYMDNNDPLTGGGVNYQDSIDVIPATSMKYDHVARSISSATGAAGLLPASMTAGTTYNYTFTGTLNSAWDTSHMHLVVMLIDGTTGTIMNSQTMNLHKTTGVNNVIAQINGVEIYPNPASEKATIKFELSNNASVKIDVVDVAGRIVMSIPESQIAAGVNEVSIPLNDKFSTGVYTVRIQTAAGVITSKLNVIK